MHIIPHVSADRVEAKLSKAMEDWRQRNIRTDKQCDLHTHYATRKFGEDEDMKHKVRNYQWEMAILRLMQSESCRATLDVINFAAQFPCGISSNEDAPRPAKLLAAFNQATLT
jgi:hypothetical protein